MYFVLCTLWNVTGILREMLRNTNLVAFILPPPHPHTRAHTRARTYTHEHTQGAPARSNGDQC